MVKLSKLIMIFDLRRQGLSFSAIARKTGLCRQTVRQHLKRGLAFYDAVACRLCSGEAER